MEPVPGLAALTQNKKKVDSLQSYINVMTAQKSATPRIKPAMNSKVSSVAAPKIIEQPKRNSDDLMIDELKTRYATDDLGELFNNEVKSGHYKQAQRLYSLLDARQSQTKKVAIFHLRLFIGLGDRDEIKKMVLGTPIEDGEFYLEKAKLYCEEHAAAQCLTNLDLAATTPGEFSDPVSLRQEILYYRALCYSIDLDGKASFGAIKKAMDAWFEVKIQFRMTPEHPHYQKAVAEMQRLGELSGKL
jgi:hypothetical protein